MRASIKEEMAAAAIAAFALAVPTNSAAEPQTPTAKEITQNSDEGLERTCNIKELNKTAGRIITRHIYDWQDVIKKYNLNPADFEKNTKLSKEQELKCAATLQAISIYEASRPNNIEAAYFYEDLTKNWPDGKKEEKVKEALENASSKSFTETLTEVTTRLQQNRTAQKEAITDLEKFKSDPNKGYSLTQKVDTIITTKQAATTKTMSAATFMNLASKNRA